MKIQKREAAVDFIRILSMLSVILLHVSSGYINQATALSWEGISLGYMLNQGVRYCVPLFFLLSGLSLELSYRNQSYVSFFAARARKILFPYLLWTVIYYWDRVDYYRLGDFLKDLLIGTAAPHLYFIVALLQLYAIFIPLYSWLGKKPATTLFIAGIISFFVQWAVYLMVFQVYILPIEVRPYILKTFLPWLFFFALGMVLARTMHRWKLFAAKHAGLLLIAATFFAGFYIVDSRSTASHDLSVKPVLFLYVPLVFLCLYGIGDWLCKKELPQKLIHFLSKHSMTIFFSHILILNYLREYGTFEGSVGMLSLYLWVSALSLLFAVIYDTLVGWVKNAGRHFQRIAE